MEYKKGGRRGWIRKVLCPLIELAEKREAAFPQYGPLFDTFPPFCLLPDFSDFNQRFLRARNIVSPDSPLLSGKSDGYSPGAVISYPKRHKEEQKCWLLKRYYLFLRTIYLRTSLKQPGQLAPVKKGKRNQALIRAPKSRQIKDEGPK